MDLPRIDAAALLWPIRSGAYGGIGVDRLSLKGVALLTLGASIALWALIISAGTAILRLGLP